MEETNYPAMKRPKRKLCYLTSKENSAKQWAGAVTLEDVDRMFDDLDSSPQDDHLPSSPLLQTFDFEPNMNEREVSPIPQVGPLMKQCSGYKMGPKREAFHPAKRSPSPNVDVDLDIPFKVHGPVITSSPIELNIDVKGVEKQDTEKVPAVSPVLFLLEDEAQEEAKSEPLSSHKHKSNGQVTEESGISDLESPPNRVAFTRTPRHKMKSEASRKQENTEPPVIEVRQEPELGVSEKNSKSVHRQPPVETFTRAGSDMTAFLQKLKEAGQAKLSCSQKSVLPVKVPTPLLEPESDDHFLILEDSAAFQFSIPSKTVPSKRQKQSRMSSSDKESSTEKATKKSPSKTPQQQQESKKAKGKLGSQIVNQKIKKKGKEKNNEVTDPESDYDILPSNLDLPESDLMEQEKPNSKQQLKRVRSKENDMAEDQSDNRASLETEKEKFSQKMETKTDMSSETKKSKSSNGGEENTKTRRTRSSKGTRKGLQGSDGVKEMVDVVKEQRQEQSSKEHADTEDLDSPIEKEIVKCDTGGKAPQNKPLVLFEGSSSEDNQAPGKRKRKQPGQWWVSCPQTTEETDNQQSTVKMSRQNSKQLSAAIPSPVKEKKSKILKKNLKETALLSRQNTNKTKEKKTKQNKNRNMRGDTPDKKKATDEVFKRTEAKQAEEQEQLDIPDEDLDQQESSPLVFTHRDHSINSGGQIFQKIYHHTSNEKATSTPAAPVSPRQPKELVSEAEMAKRRRKPPGNWWTVNNNDVDLESMTRPDQTRKQSKQKKSPGLTKNFSTQVLSTPVGGAPLPPLNPSPVFTPKTVKRSLAKFKDIFTSDIDTSAVLSSRGIQQNNSRNVTSHPAEEIASTCVVTCSKTDTEVLSMDVGECRSPLNSPHSQEIPQDYKSQANSTSKVIRSGPSSMIELEEHEENDDLTLPSSRVQAVLSVSDLCAPPLKPLVLQPKDKANLAEWFKSLWSTIAKNDVEITPDQFDWYFYRDRAMGFQVDLNSNSICNGKILLGSHMKKPLWVDHSATTVFNLFTGSVNVTIDGSESRCGPGQSFMVHCGHAYSIKNITAQPAVLYFTRILAESSD